MACGGSKLSPWEFRFQLLLRLGADPGCTLRSNDVSCVPESEPYRLELSHSQVVPCREVLTLGVQRSDDGWHKACEDEPCLGNEKPATWHDAEAREPALPGMLPSLHDLSRTLKDRSLGERNFKVLPGRNRTKLEDRPWAPGDPHVKRQVDGQPYVSIRQGPRPPGPGIGKPVLSRDIGGGVAVDAPPCAANIEGQRNDFSGQDHGRSGAGTQGHDLNARTHRCWAATEAKSCSCAFPDKCNSSSRLPLEPPAFRGPVSLCSPQDTATNCFGDDDDKCTAPMISAGAQCADVRGQHELPRTGHCQAGREAALAGTQEVLGAALDTSALAEDALTGTSTSSGWMDAQLGRCWQLEVGLPIRTQGKNKIVIGRTSILPAARGGASCGRAAASMARRQSPGLSTSWWLWLVLWLCRFCLTSASKPSSVATGFVSVNCGGGAWTDPKTGIEYQADKYFSTGRARKVRAPPEEQDSSPPTEIEKTLRAFDGPLDCYMFPVPLGRYLVRLTFFYGNHDGQSSGPVFNISVGITPAGTVAVDRLYREVVLELVANHWIDGKPLAVCFIQWPNFGSAFVNAIELRPLPALSYPLGNSNNTVPSLLYLYWRLHCGGPMVPFDSTAGSFRYPWDPLDRIWDPDWVAQQDQSDPNYDPPSLMVNLAPASRLATVTNSSGAVGLHFPNSTMDPNQVPLRLASKARTLRASAAGQALQYSFYGLGEAATFQVYLYFSNIFPTALAPGQLRMNISSNGRLVVSNFDPAAQVQGTYGAVVTITLSFNSSADEVWYLNLRPVEESRIRVPMISGIEVYQLYTAQPATPPFEAKALRALQAGFGNPPQLQSWQGNDPCQPVPWVGLRCQMLPMISTVSGIFLHQSNLSGIIAADIGNLTDLTIVWLYENHLTGEIPASMGQLTKLQNLQLQNNNLSGLVPENIAQLPHLYQFFAQNNNLSGPFPFNVTETFIQIDVVPGNPYLCSNFSKEGMYGLPYCGDMDFVVPKPNDPVLAPPPYFGLPPSVVPPSADDLDPNFGGGGGSGGGTPLPIIISLVCTCVAALVASGVIVLMLLLRRRKKLREEADAKAELEAGEARLPAGLGSEDGEGSGDKSGGAGSGGSGRMRPFPSGSASGSSGGRNSSGARKPMLNGHMHGSSSGAMLLVDEEDETEMAPFLAALQQSPWIKCLSLAEVAEATEDFSPSLLIGSGGFGPVYRGCLPNGQLVAVKRRAANSQQGTKEFCNELELLSRAHHPHLVALLGFCVEQGNHILVYEYMSRGTVRDHLYDAVGNPLGRLAWLKRLSIAVGAAKGIEYLHRGLHPSIIHRDVKTSNILLDDHFSAKLADFGLSRLGPQEDLSHVSTNVKGTAGYLDPEYYTVQHLTDRSDVFSFGVVLLELISGRQPIDLTRPRAEWNIVDWARAHLLQGQVEAIVDPTLRRQNQDQTLEQEQTEGISGGGGEFLLDALWKVAEIGILCVEPMGVNRPSISDVVKELTEAVAMELEARRGGSGGDSGLTFSDSRSPPSEAEADEGAADREVATGGAEGQQGGGLREGGSELELRRVVDADCTGLGKAGEEGGSRQEGLWAPDDMLHHGEAGCPQHEYMVGEHSETFSAGYCLGSPGTASNPSAGKETESAWKWGGTGTPALKLREPEGLGQGRQLNGSKLHEDIGE